MQSIGELNKEIEEVRDKWDELLNKRNTLFTKTLQNKYFEVTLFIDCPFIIYFHCEDFIADKTITLYGEKIDINIDFNTLRSYSQRDLIEYDYVQSISSYQFKEITKEEYNKIKNKYIK